MDINSLLSPSDTPRSSSSTPGTQPTQPPFKYVHRTQSGPAGPKRQRHGASPRSSRHIVPPSSIPAHILSPAHVPAASSPTIISATTTPQLGRRSSTQSMDTLAEVASMQTHQPVRSTPPLGRSSLSYDSQRSPSLSQGSSRPPMPSVPRASFDVAMVETPTQLARVDFTGTSLPLEVQPRLGQLVSHVTENPSAYESHVEIVRILHHGFRSHIFPPSSPNARGDPQTYDCLAGLRTSRENMNKLFGIGEDSWVEWIEDESILARSAEERVDVIELCKRAVNEERGSSKLWLAYGDWAKHCYDWAQEIPAEGMGDPDRLVGREIFTIDMVLDIWQEAVDHTRYDLSNSHITWNKYISVRIPEATQPLPKDKVQLGLDLYQQRLQTPHARWDDTFQQFSSFVSANLSADYEQLMSETIRLAANAKQEWTMRESFENAIEAAQSSNDKESEYRAFTSYIEFETTPEKHRKVIPEYANAVFERAELRFPTVAELWEEHVAHLLSKPEDLQVSLLARATKHCPWAGALWRHYLLTAERFEESYEEIEAIKHKATSSGVLEAAGMPELIKVYSTWCGYLRRRISKVDPDELPHDVAEMGIRMAIETVQDYAAKRGVDDKSRETFRLRQIYITHLTQSDRWDNARQNFDDAIKMYGSTWEFWTYFAHWEMMRWTRFSTAMPKADREDESSHTAPHLVTAVYNRALNQSDLDYPEGMMQRLIWHCEDYEDVDEIQAALVKVFKLEQQVAVRRQAEAMKVTPPQPLQQLEEQQVQQAEVVANNLHIGKRKREDEPEETSKKTRTEPEVEESVEQQTELPKRDRENATILVQNLPDDVTETRVRQFFSSCGTVRSMKLRNEEGFSAIVEFDDNDAANYALSRDGQELDGAILSVVLDTGSTLFLTNYPETADQKYFTDLLEKFGEIVSIRFPSLQGNKRRRFCYVQFKLPSEAQSATELDGKEIEGQRLVCKISNPAVKQPRQHQDDQKRKIFVGQLPFKATKNEITAAFAQHGQIEFVKLPSQKNSQKLNRGIAFITFATEEAARSALEMNGSELQGRQLTVNAIDDSNTTRQGSVSSIGEKHNSPAPRQNGLLQQTDLDSRRERTIALSNVPDTVNQSRIRAVAAEHGNVLKVILKTNHQGALVEYSTPAEAGAAALALDGHEIDLGRPLRVTTEQEMLQETAEKKVDRIGSSKPVSRPQQKGPIKRPAQPGARKGGHLGQKMMFKGEETTNGVENGELKKEKKNNEDFRAMLNQQ